MSAVVQVFLSVISSAVIGALCFSLWLAGLMFVYVSKYNSFGSGGFLVDSLSFKTSVLMAFILGLVFGCVQGFFLSILLKTLGTSSLPKSILFSFIVTEFLILSVFLVISFDTSLITMLTELFIGRLYDIIKISMVLLVPSILIGIIATKIISIVSPK